MDKKDYLSKREDESIERYADRLYNYAVDARMSNAGWQHAINALGGMEKIKSTMGQYERVCIATDGDGHNYIIPADEFSEFNRMLDRIDNGDDSLIDEFESKFAKHRTGGGFNNKQLYIKNA